MGPWFHTLLNANSPKLDLNLAKGLDQWAQNISLGVYPTMKELIDAICSLANGKVVGPDEVSVELFKITSTVILPCDGDCLILSFLFGE